MQFDRDIFISYAHIDDESLIADKKGWISEFHRALEIRLGQLMGVKPIIWRDPVLQGNHIFDKEIVDQFSKVAIMISIITPRYIKSEWCVREVTQFHEVCQQTTGFIVNNKARVFKVIKTPVSQELHPDCIKNILGYEFYTTDPATNRIKEMSPIFSHAEKGYWEKLDDLANDIAAYLEEIKATDTSAGAAQAAQQNNKQVKSIFLSESSYDTKDLRDSIKRELQDHGYNILPYGQLSLVAPVLKDNVDEYMKEAQLAIHLVGNNYGIVPEGAEKSIVEIQNEIGVSHSVAENLSRLIWIPEHMDPVDERQKVFLQKLTTGNKDVIAGADVVKGSIEDFKSVIHDKLVAMEEDNKVATGSGVQQSESSNKMVYLICDIQDLENIRPLEDFLFNSGVEVVLPIFEGDETQIREDHIENLKNCAGVIIFYGSGSEIWLRTKMRDFMKINGYGRAKPISFKGVYLAGPVSPTKQRFRTLEAEVVNGMEQLPEKELKNILSKL
ncbi:MAG: hypothetical protein K0Q79_376 [Flavipsychrobacter sp.]|jgi:hypothetical protein|nr:hypothetical protein [Flavipsychrobacter sp.]